MTGVDSPWPYATRMAIELRDSSDGIRAYWLFQPLRDADFIWSFRTTARRDADTKSD